MSGVIFISALTSSAFICVGPVVVPSVGPHWWQSSCTGGATEGTEAMKRYFGLAVAAGVLAGSMQMSADEAISITVRPSVTSFGGNALLRVLVSRNENNRVLVWEVDGPNYYRSSSMTLNGAAAARSYFFMVKELPAGVFDVRATVKRNDSSAAMDRSSIKVVGGPG